VSTFHPARVRLQDRRWYIAPANKSAEGCICETMSDAGGPTRRLLQAKPEYEELLSPVRPADIDCTKIVLLLRADCAQISVQSRLNVIMCSCWQRRR
jgi:hypothetical protein